MSGRATLTTVMSSSSMNVAIEIRTRVHHLRSMRASLENRLGRLLDREVAELLANALVEARPRKLREAADALGEADLQRRPRLQLTDVLAVERGVDRLVAGGVADVEDVGGSDDESARGQRVGRDVADDVSLHPPGKDRALVGEVVAGRANRRGGDEPVA